LDLLDARGQMTFVSLEQAEDEGALETIDSSLRYRSFHLIQSGKAALSGADALLPLVRVLLPGGAFVSRALEAIPGCRRAISFGYSTVSRLHDAGACVAAARQR